MDDPEEQRQTGFDPHSGQVFLFDQHEQRPRAGSSVSDYHNPKDKLLDARPLKTERVHTEVRDNPSKGIAYYLLHTVLMSVNLYVNKASFALNPLVGVLQFTFLRGVLATAMMLFWGYGHLRHDLVDAVDRAQLPALVFRCSQGGLSVFISFMCIKFFNVSTVGIVCSLTPLFVCLIAYWLLGERLKMFDQCALVFVFISVCLVILGAEGEESSTMSSNPLALMALISQPVLLAGGAVAMRQMKKMPETTCSTYQNLSLALLSAAFMAGFGLNFDFMFEFSWQAWVLTFLSSLLTILT